MNIKKTTNSDMIKQKLGIGHTSCFGDVVLHISE